MKPKISVIIPTYNSSETIGECLNSLLRQEIEKVYEIIVVDCSTDSTPQVVQGFEDVTLISLPERVFPGEARNVGIRRSKGDVIAFTDSDCVVDKGWLKTIDEDIDSAAVVGGSVDNSGGNLTSWADHFLSFGEFLPGTLRQIKEFVPTCNVAYRREIFEQIGYFPREQRASEDVVFNTKVSKTEEILFNPEIRILHKSRRGFRDFLKHQYLLGRNSADVRMKIPDIYGSFLTKSVFLTFFLPFIRGFKITKRVAKLDWNLVFLYITTLPLLFIGLISWSLGFSIVVGRSKK